MDFCLYRCKNNISIVNPEMAKNAIQFAHMLRFDILIDHRLLLFSLVNRV